MNLKSGISRITKTANRSIALSLTAILLTVAAPVFAHNGFDHIGGTVSKVSGNVLTVKTPTGNVDVKLDDKTTFTKNSQKAQVSDLTPGARVLVDVPEDSKDKIAHSVKIGTSAAGDHDAHK
jgi:hypothetical protein